MRVGLLHFGQSVDFVVSIAFLRSPVFAILAISDVSPSVIVSAHTRLRTRLQRRGRLPQLNLSSGGSQTRCPLVYISRYFTHITAVSDQEQA